MDKYKICPFCGAKNPTTAFECDSCEEDISRVRVTDDASGEPAKQTTDEKAGGVFVRVCEECGYKNPANARVCGNQNCGEDISHIVPTEESVEAKKTFSIKACDCDYEWRFCEGKTMVGRENAMAEYLQDKSYVSRAHGIFTLENGRLTYENLKTTNKTRVNSDIIGVEAVELHDGDEIAFGVNEREQGHQNLAAYFTVKIQ